MRITIIGAGNIGTQFAVHCEAKGHQVTFYTKNYEKISKDINIVDGDGNIKLSAHNITATNNKEIAFKDADIVFVTVPAFMMKDIAQEIIDYLPAGTKVALIPGTGGGECAFKPFIDKGGVVFGLQRVPSVARLVEYGKTVCAEGYRGELFVSALPNKYSDECANFMQNIFDIKCSTLPNYLNLTLTPSNPILHTSRLYSLFKDYQKGTVYKYIPLFYEEWDDDSSQTLLTCDEELQNLCKNLKVIDLSEVKSLKLHYESDTTEKMTAKICSIKSLQGLSTPSIKVEGGYIPDFNSRYFTADFPYGLAIIRQIGEFCRFEMPNINKLYNWYKNMTKDIKEFNYKEYNINTLEELAVFYLK